MNHRIKQTPTGLREGIRTIVVNQFPSIAIARPRRPNGPVFRATQR